MKIDIVMTWPKSLDFPIWRSFLKNNRDRFDKVLIAFADNSSPYDYRTFLKSHSQAGEEKISWIDPKLQLSHDWRNNATNSALVQSEAEWVWFTEPDFLIKDPSTFFEMVYEKMKKSDVIYYLEGDRKHPACMFVKRELINKTSKDFGVVPGLFDHFGKFTAEIDGKKPQTEFLPKERAGIDFYHLNGLTHNYHLVMSGDITNVYQPGIFLMYNNYARMQQIAQSPDFIKLTFQADYLLMPLTKCFQGN